MARVACVSCGPSGYQLPVPQVRVAGCGASSLGFGLLQGGRHALGYSEASVSFLASLVSSLVAWYPHVGVDGWGKGKGKYREGQDRYGKREQG